MERHAVDDDEEERERRAARLQRIEALKKKYASAAGAREPLALIAATANEPEQGTAQKSAAEDEPRSTTPPPNCVEQERAANIELATRQASSSPPVSPSSPRTFKRSRVHSLASDDMFSVALADGSSTEGDAPRRRNTSDNEAEDSAERKRALHVSGGDVGACTSRSELVPPEGLRRRAASETALPRTRGIDDSDWADANGYYIFQAGEVIESKYRVLGQRGRGVFSNVAFAVRLGGEGEPENVAIKVLRRNETMRRAGSKEESLLQDIRSKAGAPARKYIVAYIESFYHRKHLCLVFEAMKMNLRQVLYRFGRNIGINIEGVRRYSRHMFRALLCLESMGIVHADVKLDNILVSNDLQHAKLCDFGCAFYEGDPRAEDTSYLVSRFYRAPEVILGLPREFVGKPIDVWALATCMFELYAGNVMFPGRSNNDLLRLIMRTKGRIPNRIIKRHIAASVRREPHFEPDSLAFREVCAPHVVAAHPALARPPIEPAAASALASGRQAGSDGGGPAASRVVRDATPARGVQSASPHPASLRIALRHVAPHPAPQFTVLHLLESSKSSSAQDRHLLPHLARLIDQALLVDPLRRISPQAALESDFFSAQSGAASEPQPV